MEQLYSYHFIANFTSYLNAAGFLNNFFSFCGITDWGLVGGIGMGGGDGWEPKER